MEYPRQVIAVLLFFHIGYSFLNTFTCPKTSVVILLR